MATPRRRGQPPGRQTNGRFIRQERESLPLTQVELAKRAGVSKKTVMRAENDERIGKDSLERLARALDVSITDLLRSPQQALTERLTRFGLAPPAPPAPWVPRSDEARRVIERITASPPRICCISGPSGIGKTALARYVARDAASRFSHGVVWVAASARDPRPRDPRPSDDRRPVGDRRASDPRQVQMRIAEALEFRSLLPPPEHVDEDTFDAAFARAFWSQHRLLILDDILSPEYARHFIPGDRPVPVIATSHRLQVAERYGDDAVVLDPLGVGDTRRILADYLDEARLDGEGVAAVHRELGGVPRSVHIAGKLLQHKRLMALTDYTARIHSDLPGGEYPESLRTPENSLQLSFSLVRDHVSPDAWSLLAAISLFEEVPFSIEWASAAGSIDGRSEVEGCLSELIDLYLLAEVTPHDSAASRPLDARRFRLESHVPLFARNLLRDRWATALEALARHAVDVSRAAAAEQDWSAIRGDLALWTHVLDTLLCAIVDPDELTGRDIADTTALPDDVSDDFFASSMVELMVELVVALAPFLEHECIPGSERWLRLAATCALALRRPAVHGRLLLALGRFWLRASVDLETPVPWLDRATVHLAEANDFSHASAAASEAGRALFGCEKPVDGLQRFERAIALAREAHDHGAELACRLNSAAVSFTRDPDTSGWQRAAGLLADAVAACHQSDFDGQFIRIACMCNALTTRHAMQSLGISPGRVPDGEFAGLIVDWRELDIDAPLFEARLLLLEALQGRGSVADEPQQGLYARARSLWRDRLDDDEVIDVDLLWQLTELAFYVRLQLEHDLDPTSAPSPVIAGGLGLTDVTREIPTDNKNLVPIGLLFPVRPLVPLFDDAYMDRTEAAWREIMGDDNRRLLDELSRIRELRAH